MGVTATALSLAAVPVQAAAPDDVAALLAAGEFGAAADVAAQADAAQRQQLMQRVVHAQIDSGNPAGAQASLRRLGRDRARVDLGAQAAQSQMLNGGANFQELMFLILQETSGPWMDTDAEGGTMAELQSGVRVDPSGVLARESKEDASGRLAALSQTARQAALNDDMARSSSLRLVSLTRLEREVTRRLDEGKPAAESMQRLAGLSQIQYVFVYPESGEIVIGGPAEGWRYGAYGAPVGIASGRPTLQLDDLVTVLRTFSPAGQAIFGCSIDPRQENLKAVKDFVAASQSSGPLSPAGVKTWANKIGQTLGLQDISVFGVPANSRVARVIVEADYRMKLIGVGKLNAGSHVPDYFDLLAKDSSLASGGLDALRWWLTMKYDAVMHAPNQRAFEIRGSAVQCLSENQFLGENGQRVATGKAEPVNQLFAANFTKHYQELAQKDPVFADLQGVFDLALVAALIQRNHLDQQAGWDRGSFSADGEYHPAVFAAPKQTESVVNHRVYNGKDVVLQVAGGVRGDVVSVLKDAQVNQESPRLAGVSESAKAQDLPAGRWWWDAR